MQSRSLLSTTDAVAVLSGDAHVRLALASSAPDRPQHAASSVDELLTLIDATRTRTVVIDHAASDAPEALLRLASVSVRNQLLVILVIRNNWRDAGRELPRGADIIVVDAALPDAVLLANKAARIHERPLSIDRLLGVSVLSGPLDQSLEAAAEQLAAGFGVDRCLISVRGDSTGGAASGTRTWSSLTWSQTAAQCRAAAVSASTLIATAIDPEPRASSESYLAVPLESPLGSGFLGLVVDRPRIFNREIRVALESIATRLASELAWRGMHERAADDLDRSMNGPGIDPLLEIWNRAALAQLTAMQVSASLRYQTALSVAIVDVHDLQSINTRFGLASGDRLLQRIADAVRTTVREEDLVGRWSGDEIAIVLQGIGLEGAQRVAERIHEALSDRQLELPAGERLPIRATIGVATIQLGDGSLQLLARASTAARQAQDNDEVISHSKPASKAPRISQQFEEVGEDIASTIGGAYRVLHEISRGGMGVVYRAQDRALERPVAIKMLRPDLTEDPEVVERFRHEAAMLAHLQHPNLVQIYSFGHTGGDSYFVMELVEGESLEQAYVRHRGEGTAMSLTELVGVIEQIASALDALHDRGVVHRDVKPANVIRDPFRSRSVLVDVGIARRYGHDTRSAGTPGFVAPEVFADQEATARSDVYGLAATAYAMLTLTRPWGDGDFVSILARQCSEEVRPPSELRPELAETDAVLLRALSKDPALRPASAGAFARELAAAVSGSPSDGDPRRDVPIRSPGRRVATTLGEPMTRGVVFRSVPRAVGLREAGRLRDAISGNDPELAHALHETTPLGWLPTELFARLLTVAPEHVGRDRSSLARDIARATVRTSFRRFFPASSATLVPERTLSAIRNVWARYQSWGTISSMQVHSNEVVVRLADPVLDPALCEWTSGLLEQLVVLSGGKQAVVDHSSCEACGGEACLFRVSWELAT